MPSAKLDGSSNPVMTFWLSRELEKEIPELDIYGSEKKLLEFACKDLETCLKANWKNTSITRIEEGLNRQEQEELKQFLKVWTKQWLEKWRERVTFCQKTPRFSLAHARARKKALKAFKQMDRGKELKDLTVQKLINSGEVCMAELIAENLIVEEIAQRLKENRKTSDDETILDPWHILQAVLPRIRQLAEKKTPIIHLKLMTDV